MFTKLGLQLYTCRDCFHDEASFDQTLAALAKLGYSEAHTAGRYGLTPEKFNEILKKNGFSIIGTHYDFNAILNNVEETVALHQLYGTTNVGIGGMPDEAHKDLDSLKKFIRDYNTAAEKYAKYGMKLNYHNHHFEFKRIDGTKTIFDYLYNEFDPDNISFVLDTCWVSAGCSDLRKWLEKLAGRVDILHIKDVMLVGNGPFYGDMTEVGSGLIQWADVLKTAEDIGVKHYIMEQDGNFVNGDPVNSAGISAAFLKQFMK